MVEPGKRHGKILATTAVDLLGEYFSPSALVGMAQQQQVPLTYGGVVIGTVENLRTRHNSLVGDVVLKQAVPQMHCVVPEGIIEQATLIDELRSIDRFHITSMSIVPISRANDPNLTQIE